MHKYWFNIDGNFIGGYRYNQHGMMQEGDFEYQQVGTMSSNACEMRYASLSFALIFKC